MQEVNVWRPCTSDKLAAASVASYPSTPAFSVVSQADSTVMRKLEQLEKDLQVEIRARRDAQEKLMALLEGKAH